MEEVKNEKTILRDLSLHIGNKSFPCVMAKAVEKLAGITVSTADELESESSVMRIHQELSAFVDRFRVKEQLSSFVLTCDENKYKKFEDFESDFWTFLKSLRDYDQQFFEHDARVSSDPGHHEFSFSVKSEAFFILMLHPDSPRLARRFKYPAIVFNPHIQFERMRLKGVFDKVRTLIRNKDKILQGSVNPMLSDFGERSEVFQYVGKVYAADETVPLLH